MRLLALRERMLYILFTSLFVLSLHKERYSAYQVLFMDSGVAIYGDFRSVIAG